MRLATAVRIGRRCGRWPVALGLVATLCAMAPQRWGPNGNGTLDHADDRRWLVFAQAGIVADNARGVYIATFPDAVRRMAGSRITIAGYMLPLDASTVSPHFVLTRRSTGCPFCPANEPSEAIEVTARKPLRYTQDPVTLSGTLRLVARSETGLFYRLEDATP